jgi:hypothetical protein
MDVLPLRCPPLSCILTSDEKNELTTLNAEQRYVKLIEEKPGILQSIPVYTIHRILPCHKTPKPQPHTQANNLVTIVKHSQILLADFYSYIQY